MLSDNTRFELTRRGLLTGALTGAALAGLPDWAVKEAQAAEREREAALPRKFGPNDQINFAVIGPGGSKGGYRQGLGDTHAAARQKGCKVIAVCDLDKQHREEAAAQFKETVDDKSQYHDYRELLARKDIDAVVIGTPDHWHATIAMAAMRAGKDVYCEKPLTLYIDEGKQLVKVAKETGRILQTGSQQRSDARFRQACELVRNGRLGKLTKVIAHLPTGPKGGPFMAQPVPEGFDWDMWLGQAPQVDYMKERTHGVFRWWLDYSGGMLTDWGAHHLDIAQWGLGTDRSGPLAVEGTAEPPKQEPNCYTTFPAFDVTFTYPNGVSVLATNKGENGVEFIGENGTIFVSRSRIGATDPQGKPAENLLNDPLPDNAVKLTVSNYHMVNFVDCIRSRKQPICEPEIGHRSVSVCHLANICLRLGGHKLEWDPKAEMFKNSKEANALLTRPKRKVYGT